MTPEEHADSICRWTNASLRDLVVHEISVAIAEEQERCIKAGWTEICRLEEYGTWPTEDGFVAAIRARMEVGG